MDVFRISSVALVPVLDCPITSPSPSLMATTFSADRGDGADDAGVAHRNQGSDASRSNCRHERPGCHLAGVEIDRLILGHFVAVREARPEGFERDFGESQSSVPVAPPPPATAPAHALA